MDPVLRPFHPQDLLEIRNRDGSELPPVIFGPHVAGFPAFTAVVEGVPIGCAGVTLPWPGVGHAWMVLSDAVEDHALWMFRMVKGVLRDVQRAYHLHRIETEALEASARNQQWLTGLGFRREANGTATALLPDKRSMVRYEFIEGGH